MVMFVHKSYFCTISVSNSIANFIDIKIEFKLSVTVIEIKFKLNDREEKYFLKISDF